MKYNEEYKLWVSKDGLLYRRRINKRKNIDQLVLCKVSQYHGYEGISRSLAPVGKSDRVHRIVWETFNGTIPEGYEIDHINSVRDDNRLENLQLLTPLENVRKAQCGRVHSIEERLKRAASNRHPRGKYKEAA